MSSFYGTIEDVNKHLMPRIRNRVQTLTKPYKSLENGVLELNSGLLPAIPAYNGSLPCRKIER